KMKLVSRRNRNHGLQGITVCCCDYLADRKRVASCERRVLIFSSYVSRKPSSGGICRKTVPTIESFFVRAPMVIDDGLSEVVAVVHRRAIDSHKTRVNRFNANPSLLAAG